MLTRIVNLHFFANVLYIRPIRRISLLISSTGQCSELLISTDRVLAGLLTNQVIVSRVKCSVRGELLCIDFNTRQPGQSLSSTFPWLSSRDQKGSFGRKGNC